MKQVVGELLDRLFLERLDRHDKELRLRPLLQLQTQRIGLIGSLGRQDVREIADVVRRRRQFRDLLRPQSAPAGEQHQDQRQQSIAAREHRVQF